MCNQRVYVLSIHHVIIYIEKMFSRSSSTKKRFVIVCYKTTKW
jgi:hypothetical protein